MRLILASASVTRRRLMDQAGIAHEVIPADIDEDAVKARWTGTPGALALDLARRKAERVAATHPNALVIGADQVMDLDGTICSKPGDADRAARQLVEIAGKTHRLSSGMVVMRGLDVLFEHGSEAYLAVWPLSEREISDYVAAAPASAWQTVGGYEVEDMGIRLFERIEGDWHSILGLPILPLKRWLREENGG